MFDRRKIKEQLANQIVRMGLEIPADRRCQFVLAVEPSLSDRELESYTQKALKHEKGSSMPSFEFWSTVSVDSKLPWTIELIETFRASLDWTKLSTGEAFCWTILWLKLFWPQIKVLTLSEVRDPKRVAWSIELIKEFRREWKSFQKWSTNGGPLGWNLDFLREFSRELDWSLVSGACPLFASSDVIEEFKDRIDFKALTYNSVCGSNFDFIRKYRSQLDWSTLSRGMGIRWTDSLIDEFKDELNFNEMSSSAEVEWSVDLIRKHQKKLNFKSLSEQRDRFPWSETLIAEFEDRWNWGTRENDCDYRGGGSPYLYGGLSSNERLPWSAALLARFKDRWVKECLESLPSIQSLLRP